MLAIATKVLNDYSKVLASIEPSNLGFAESFLPHSKSKIRTATKLVLEQLGNEQPALREALIRGFVYLEQFVSDQDAEVLLMASINGTPILPNEPNAAGQIAGRIKADMDRALKEITAIGVACTMD